MIWLDDLDFLLRFAHVAAAILWVGSAFALLKLDVAMRPPSEGAAPRALFLHAAGGFFISKAESIPPEAGALSFKWEAYATFFSGFLLLLLLCLASPENFLIDPSRWAASPNEARAAAILPLILSWLGYDVLCRRGGLAGDRLLIACFVYFAAIGLVLTQVFAGRGAFLLLGAHIATTMTANIAHVVTPAQKHWLAARRAREAPEPKILALGGQRALHNQYLALPALALMLSNHAPQIFDARFNGAAMILLLAALFCVRRLWIFFARGLGVDIKMGGLAAALTMALVWLTTKA